MSLSKKAAEHLKALRIYNGLNTEQFAKLIGQKREAVSRWEHGRQDLRMKTFDKICTDLGLEPENFICGLPEVKLDIDKITSSKP